MDNYFWWCMAVCVHAGESCWFDWKYVDSDSNHKIWNFIKGTIQYLIASLALADCVNFLATPFECIAFSNILNTDNYRDKRLMNIACYLLSVFGIVSFYGNACHIFVVALERFLSINFPLKSLNIISIFSTKLLCVIVWLVIIFKLGIDFVLFNNGLGFEFCLWNIVFKPGIYNFSIIILL